MADSHATSVVPVKTEPSVNEKSRLLASAPALLINEASGNEDRDEENPPPVVLSNSRLTFLEELRQRVARVPAYIMGEDLSERAMSPR